MDGYRRLERTRSVVGAAGAASVGVVKPDVTRRRPRVTRARVAGAMRLVGFIGVLALIVGTSVSIASADDRPAEAAPVKSAAAADPVRQPVAEEPAVSEAVAETTGVEKIPVVAREADKSGVAPADADVAEAGEPAPSDALAVDASSSVGTASGEVPQRALPFTGEAEVRRLVLGGAIFVLLGMLVQVAGQPLPARSHARARA